MKPEDKSTPADFYNVPEGYALIAIPQLKTWGVYEDVMAACQYPVKKPAECKPVAWRYYNRLGELVGGWYDGEPPDYNIREVAAFSGRIECAFNTPQPCPKCVELEADRQEGLECMNGWVRNNTELQAKVAELEKDISIVVAENEQRRTKLKRAEVVIEKCRLPLELNLVFMDTPVEVRKVQPYTETYDAIAAIATYKKGEV